MLASHCGGLGSIPGRDMSVLGPSSWGWRWPPWSSLFIWFLLCLYERLNADFCRTAVDGKSDGSRDLLLWTKFAEIHLFPGLTFYQIIYFFCIVSKPFWMIWNFGLVRNKQDCWALIFYAHRVPNKNILYQQLLWRVIFYHHQADSIYIRYYYGIQQHFTEILWDLMRIRTLI